MVLEVAILQIKEGKSVAFEDSFHKASQLISCQKCYTIIMSHFQQ
jgi:hypothetical protein